ncbi:MAG: hypothetical protein H7232_05165 [Aeromicrobium sp.]|nr:hypothetical protein [Burkholderiales bacterium]
MNTKPQLHLNTWLKTTLTASFLFVFMLLVVAQRVNAAAAPANSTIGNQATATYVDSGSVSRTASSNSVQTTVAQVYASTLNQSGSKTVPPNQQVCFPHSITNNGNGTDTFALIVPTGGSLTGIMASSTATYYIDAVTDGVPDNSTPLTSTGPVAAGATFSFVVCATSGTGANGATGTIVVSATDSQTTAVPTARTNTVTLGLAALTVTKSLCLAASVAPACTPVTGGAAGAGPFKVILSYTNSGSTAADYVKLVDALPTGWVYVPSTDPTNKPFWSGSGTALTDAVGGDGAAIDYTYTSGTRTVAATITQVPGSTTGFVSFFVTIGSNLPVGVSAATTNTATYAYSYNSGSTTVCVGSTTVIDNTAANRGSFCSVGGANTNNVTYAILQTAAVAANASATTAGLTDPVGPPADTATVTSAAAGATIQWSNYIWNRGNAADSFDVSLPGTPLNGSTCALTPASNCTFPPGTTFQILASGGSATLQDTNGNGTPDTGNIPRPTYGAGTWSCPAPYIMTATDVLNPASVEYCGLEVVIKATIPAGAAPGNNSANGYRVVVEAKSFFNTAILDTVINVLTAIAANSVDLTNDKSVTGSTPIVGGGNALVGDGFGATAAAIIRTVTVTPTTSTATSATFNIVVNNTGAAAGLFNLTGALAARSNATLAAAPALPTGWAITFKAGACPGVATITATSSIPKDGNEVVCAVVTVPPTSTSNSGLTQPTTAPPGDYDFDFTATIQGGSATDTIRDRVTVAPLRAVTIAPNGAQSTVPGGAVTYNHTITNNGNVPEALSLASLLNSQSPTYAWNASLYVDTNGNGIYDGPDTLISGTSSLGADLAPNATLLVFVRVSAPSAAGSPPNTTTLTVTYTYSATGLTTSATDLTTITAGLLLDKYQTLVGCGPGTAPSVTLTAGVPNAPWSKNPIAAGSGTRPGQCIAYLVVGSNTTSTPITNIALTDQVPAFTTFETGCSPVAASQTSGPLLMGTTNGTLVTYSTGYSGLISAVSNPLSTTALSPGGYITMQFCVKINP